MPAGCRQGAKARLIPQWKPDSFRLADHPFITDELGLFNLGSVAFSFDLQFVGEHYETLGIELLRADVRGSLSPRGAGSESQ